MASTERIELNRSRNFGELLGDTFAFLRINASLLLRVHLFLSLPLVLLVAALFLLLFNDFFSLLSTIETGPFEDSVAYRANSNAWFVQNLFFPGLVFSIVSLNTLLVFHLYQQFPDRKPSFQDILDALRGRFFQLLVAKVALFVLIFLPQLVTLSVELVGLRILLSLLLGTISLLFYSLGTCTELLVLQHKYDGFKAIGKSFYVMEKYFWSSVGVHLVALLIFFFLSLAMNIPPWILENWESIGLGETVSGGFFDLFASILTAFSTILGYLLFSIPAAVSGILFFSLKEKTNRASIMERIQAIGTRESTANIYQEDEQY